MNNFLDDPSLLYFQKFDKKELVFVKKIKGLVKNFQTLQCRVKPVSKKLIIILINKPDLLITYLYSCVEENTDGHAAHPPLHCSGGQLRGGLEQTRFS